MLDQDDDRTLFERTAGPNAVDIAILVARGEEADACVKRDYREQLDGDIARLETLLDGASLPEGIDRWNAMKEAAQDLRSSAATAGHDHVSCVASSLEWLLAVASAGDARVSAVIRLHIDGLKQLADMGVQPITAADVQRLLAELGRASNHVTRRL